MGVRVRRGPRPGCQRRNQHPPRRQADGRRGTRGDLKRLRRAGKTGETRRGSLKQEPTRSRTAHADRKPGISSLQGGEDVNSRKPPPPDGDTTEFRYSDITDADRERYEETKAAEFEAAATIAACDAESGYSEAADEEYRRQLLTSYLEMEPDYENHLAELEAALTAVTVD
ncbi:hypothetical protein GCM10027447_04960 [Glycomyces halotolerans]